MIGKLRLAVRLHGGMPVADCVAQARAAEDAGFAAVWFAENPFARGILPAATACALATRSIAIGAGVFNPFNRHPSLMAMEIGALDEVAAGRARLGIGAGIGSVIERIGLSYARPVTAVAEAIAIVRALLRGEEVTYRGKIFAIERVKLDYAPRPDIAIFMAGRGDRSLEVAGEIADGLILSNMSTPDFAARAGETVAKAARAAGRARLPAVVRYLPCFVADDRSEAVRAALRAVGGMLPAFWALGERFPGARIALMEGSGIAAAEFATAAQRLRGGDDASAVLDERYVAAFALAGTPADVRTQVTAAEALGVTELALTFADDGAASIGALAGALAER